MKTKSMIFRNTGIVFFIFIWLISCKGTQFYASSANPANVGIWLDAPGSIYSNAENNDSISCYLINHNSKTLRIDGWMANFSFIGQSRFYKKELIWSPLGMGHPDGGIELPPNDSVLLLKFPVSKMIAADKKWNFNNKAVNGPQMATLKKYAPYFYLTASIKVQVPNQQDIIEVRSERKRINVVQKTDPGLANKKTVLTLGTDVKEISAEKPEGNLSFHIKNISAYPIYLFEDPGSVKFKIYAYNPNRTSVMHTECILNNGKLAIEKKTIQPQAEAYILSVPLAELMYTAPPAGARFFWAWNKKTPPVSPLVYGKKSVAPEVEYWFGIVVDGKEYISNTVLIKIKEDGRKKRNKK